MIIDLGSPLEIVRVTAEYSNAVLVAVMPYISDVALRLDLPVPHPVKAEHVVHCSITPLRSWGVEVGLKDGWVFAFSEGHVRTIQGPHEFYTMQDPSRVPEYFGEPRISRTEAIQMARGTLKKLGIPLESVFAEQEPRVQEPFKVGTNTVPHYHIEWLDPRGGRPCVDMDINGQAKRVERIRFLSESLERPPPKLSVVPPRDPRSPRWPPFNPEYAWRLLPHILCAVDEYGQRLSLPIPRPLTTNHIARFRPGDNGGWVYSELELTNGWRFTCCNSTVSGYDAPDAFFAGDKHPFLIKNFTGQWNMTEPEAIELVKHTVSKLGYPTNLVHFEVEPRVSKPAVPGIPRYKFTWYFERGEQAESTIWAEVDAARRELKSLFFGHKALWSQLPLIDLPISLPLPPDTNSAPAPPAGSSQLPPTTPPWPMTPFSPPKRL